LLWAASRRIPTTKWRSFSVSRGSRLQASTPESGGSNYASLDAPAAEEMNNYVRSSCGHTSSSCTWCTLAVSCQQ
jgi:hypothetical protein